MNNNTFVHKYIRPLIHPQDITVDMTAGNGNDTLFLSELSKEVIAFDISEEAIRRTKEKIKGRDNVTLIHDSHVNVDRYVKNKVRLFLFNLGYLPHSDEPTVSKAEDTLLAFQKAYELLEENGYIVITFYLGHRGGKDEFYLLDDYIRKNRFQITETYSQHKMDSPVTYIIRKR
ncbi:MAG: class I SAM-dependent methyltransferase [Erysipelotrichaceae bacterium]|nr:class I SAM-dependent methyltransferase [Erysipelotrichaceae bacterium]